MSKSSVLKRFRSLFVTVVLIAATNLAISYAGNMHNNESPRAAVNPSQNIPKPRAAVNPSQNIPKPRAAVNPSQNIPKP